MTQEKRRELEVIDQVVLTCLTMMGIIAGALFTPTPAAAQLVPEWENPAVVHMNTEPPHATLYPYPDEAAALEFDPLASPWVRSLNGNWRFHWAPRPEERPVGSAADSRRAGRRRRGGPY